MGSNRILEMIARNELLDPILREIIQLVERQQAGVHCAVLYQEQQRPTIAASRDLPQLLLEQLKAKGVVELASRVDSSLDRMIQAIGPSDSADPVLDLPEFRFLPIQPKPGSPEVMLAVSRPGQSHTPADALVMTRRYH